MRSVGFFFFPPFLILVGSIILSLKYDIYKGHSEIIMIALAAYTFYKLVTAIVNFRKARKDDEATIFTIRNINIAEALISLLNLQMAMFQSFGTGETENSHVMNIISGAAVSLLVLILGLLLVVKASKKLR